MSGGELTDYRHNLYDIEMWANKIEHDNPLLAEQMHDLYILLNKYDDYLSADIGEDAIQRAWNEYSRKWMNMTEEGLKEFMMRKCEACIDSMVKGWHD